MGVRRNVLFPWAALLVSTLVMLFFVHTVVHTLAATTTRLWGGVFGAGAGRKAQHVWRGAGGTAIMRGEVNDSPLKPWSEMK